MKSKVSLRDFKDAKSISNIKPFSRIHGGKNALTLPNKSKIIDFSISVNPYGPPPETKLSIDFAHVKEYPDPESKELRKLIASLNNVNEANIFIGNGSPDIDKKELYLKVKVPDTHNLKRIFYNRAWFIDLVPNARIFERKIPNYKNSQFRFNVLIQK